MAKNDQTHSKQQFPIVGVGASAGGFEALRQLLQAMPRAPGIAIVIIQHLARDKTSLAPELLSNYTTMEVRQVKDEPVVQPNHVYIIPPGQYLVIRGGTLALSKMEAQRSTPVAIDAFLRSLAQDQQKCAVGVILSGTGSDGALGVKAVHEAGGMVIAQSPGTAQHDSMPRNAIDTGAVDHVLAPPEMADVLVRHARHPYVVQDANGDREGQPDAAEDLRLAAKNPVAEWRKPTGDNAGSESESVAPPDEDGGDEAGLAAIIALLKSQTGRNYHHYKDATLLRRTRRRMCLHTINEFGPYLDLLRRNSQEVEALAKDLLICVTDFFRDREAWEKLASDVAVPIVESLDGKSGDNHVRVWVPGCATGEEAYSVAIVFLEELDRQRKTGTLQIFASDIDPSAINIARIGCYPRSIEVDVSPERLHRYFTLTDDDCYQVNKLMRDAVVFAEQDLVADPPFSRLDLVCCRNVLIYLKPEVQRSIIALIHFALREGGYLMLGTAETLGRQEDLFQTINKRWRIYQGVGPTRHDRIDLPITSVGHRSETVATSPQPRRDVLVAQIAQKTLIDMTAPSAVLVDRHWRILYISGNVDRYLTRAAGVPSDDLLKSARGGLRSKLRVAVHQALDENQGISTTCRVDEGEESRQIYVEVQPVSDGPNHDPSNPVWATVLFRELNDAPQELIDEESQEPDITEETIIRRLEDELTATRDDLQATVEQFEASSEAFKASNEEVMSINEELQSTNEELETSKEELQSLNEELATVNQQLALKVGELESKHADLENLISATEIATICLKDDLTIRWFTPAAERVARLRRSDLGRSLADIKHDFITDDFAQTCDQVLKKLLPIEDEQECHDGRVFLRRVAPYLAEHRTISGVLVTLVEITERRKREKDVRASRERFRRALSVDGIGVLFLRADGTLIDCNEWFLELTGYSREEVQSGNVTDKEIPVAELAPILDCDVFDLSDGTEVATTSATNQHQSPKASATSARNKERFGPIEREFRRRDGSPIWMMMSGCVMEDDTTVVHCIDITDRKQVEETLKKSEERLRMATSAAQLGWYSYDVENDRSDWSSELRQLHDFSEDEPIRFERVLTRIHPDDRQRFLQHRQDALHDSGDRRSSDHRYEGEFRIVRDDGSERWLVDRGRVLYSDDPPRPQMAIGMVMDITDRKIAESKLHELNKTLEDQVTRRTELLGILQYVTRIANEDNEIDDTMRRAMEKIATFNGWIVGHVWQLTDDDQGKVQSSGIWYVQGNEDETDVAEVAATFGSAVPSPTSPKLSASSATGERTAGSICQAAAEFREFQRQTAQTKFTTSEGLIGRVIDSGQPAWTDDIHADDRWKRQVPGLPLHAAVAFPIMIEQEVVAVMEFFAGAPSKPQPRLLEILPDIGIQLGHAVSRKRTERVIAKITNEEQRRIGRELHDGISQQLTGGALIAETLRQSLPRELTEQREHVSQLAELLKSTHQDVRDLSSGLMAETVTAAELATSLQALTAEVDSRFEVDCEFVDEQYDESGILNDDIAWVIYQVAREAVHNAVKHAEAERILVTLKTNTQIRLIVQDDGKGFDPEIRSNKTNGIRIMKYRAESIGGTLKLRSSQGSGTIVAFMVPRKKR